MKDSEFLMWLRDRLEFVYDESPLADFVIRLKDMAHEALLKEAALDAEPAQPVAWMPISVQWPFADLDILFSDGSVVMSVIPQSDGDFWWKGGGAGERFFDPVYSEVTHWRSHAHSSLSSAPQPVAWRDHVEQRLRMWRQSHVNRSGDQLALDDFMDSESLEDLIDFVCDEWAGPQPPADVPRLTIDEIGDLRFDAFGVERVGKDLVCVVEAEVRKRMGVAG